MKASQTVFLAMLPLAAIAAEVERVVVRQQWPWSTDVQVECELSGVTGPTDLQIRAFNGDAELPSAKLRSAISGAYLALTSGGVKRFTIDPVKAFGTSSETLPDFRVQVTAVDSTDSVEVLYKIVNLESPYDVQDVTRAQLLNGEMGAVETDYAELGAKYGATFSTSLEDVCIWTGVTNDVKYKSTHMVLRKIPAKGKSFKFLKGLYGKPVGATSYQYLPGYDTSFTNDFYIGVFEVTQTQFRKLKAAPAHGNFNETAAQYAAYRPADNLYWRNDLRGTADNSVLWPDGDHTDVASPGVLAVLQNRTGLVFDLPTEAMWEFACRAGTDTDLYTGQDYSAEVAALIMRAKGVNAPNSTATAAADCDLSSGPNIVGSYLPNAYGLYDMLGNVSEQCLDRHDGTIPTGGVDPRGVATVQTSTDNYRVIKGGAYNGDQAYRCGNRGKDHQTYNVRPSGFRVCLYPDFSL